MITKLRKLIFLKYFSSEIKLGVALAILVLFVLLNNSSILNNSASAYPFTEAREYKVLDDPRHAIEGDFNGDGDLDVAIVNFRTSYISVAINNGDATFKDAVNYPSGGIGPLSIAAINYDGDADMDLAVVNYNSGDIRLHINNGAGVFSLDPVTYLAGTRPSSIVADDFNGDTNTDLAVTNAGSDNVSILLGDGAGGFAAASNYDCPPGSEPLQVISADFNNDTNKDLAIVNVGRSSHINTLSIHFGVGDGSFLGLPSLCQGGTRDGLSCNKNNGDADCTGGGQCIITKPIFIPGREIVSVTAGDFDNDTDLDLALIGHLWQPRQTGLRILENDGLGNFNFTLNNYSLSERSASIVAGDFNNDGDLDVAVTDFTDNTVSMLPGNGDLTFLGAQNFNVGNGPIYLLTADFDGDTKKDIISLNKGENNHIGTLVVDIRPGDNSFSFLRNNGIAVIESDKDTLVREGGANDTYEVVLSSVPANDVTITISHDVSQLDILPVIGTLIFTNLDWDTPQTVTVSADNDATLEGEHFSLIIHSAVSLDPNFNGLKIPSVNVQIADDDQAGVTVYEFGGITEIEENGITDQYSLVLETAPTDNVVITIDSDIQMTALPSVLTFTPTDWDTPQTVTLTAVNDWFIEGLEQRIVSHTVASADLDYNLIVVNDVSVDLLDNNYLNHGILCTGMMGDLVYNFQFNGLDLVQLNLMISGAVRSSFCGEFDGDGIRSPTDRTEFVKVLIKNYYETAEVPIVESAGSTDVAEGGSTDTYLVYLRRRPISDVVVNIGTDSQLSTDETQLIFTNPNFMEAQEVTVTAADDFYIEATPHNSTITHTAFSGDFHYDGLAVSSVTANITDNDTAGVIVTESGGSTQINETGETSDNIFMRLSSVPTNDVIMDLTTPDTQTTVLPSQVTFNNLDWNINQELIVTAVDDDLYEDPLHVGNVLGTMSSLDPNYVGAGSWGADITDNDVLPTISINDVSLEERDGGPGFNYFNFSVSLSTASGLTTTVNYDTANGTATIADNDYQAASDFLIFNPGEVLKIVPVVVNKDTKAEAHEIFYVNLSSPTNATILDDQGIGTIIDDDGGTGGTITPDLLAISDLSCEAVNNDKINWNFEYISEYETGFRLYEPIDTYSAELILEINEPDLSQIPEGLLETNSQYTRYVTAFNNINQSGPSNTASCYTLANVPNRPGAQTGVDYITIILDPEDGNPEYTEYAIIEANAGNYVHSDGSFLDVEIWQTYEDWGSANGITVVGGEASQPIENEELIIALDTRQSYNFAVKARNGDGIETAFSPGTTGEIAGLEPAIVISKGVGINVSQGQISQVFAKAVLATSGQAAQSIGERLIIEFSLILNIILIILVILLLVSIYEALKYIQVKGVGKKIKVAFNLLHKEPAGLFSQHTSQDKKGTYENSYQKYKKLHEQTQKTVERALGVIILKLVILVVLIFGVIGVNHQGIAQLSPYNQDGQDIQLGDILSYQISFVNQGELAATNIIVTDIMDTYVGYIDGSGVINKGGDEDEIDGVTRTNQQISFSVGNLAASESGYAMFDVQVNSDEVGRQITNQAQISGSNITSQTTNTVTNTIIETVSVPVVEPPITPPEQPIEPPVTPPVVPPTPPTEPPVIPSEPSIEPPITPPATSGQPTEPTPPSQPRQPDQPPVTPAVIQGQNVMNIVQTGFFDNPRVEDVVVNIITPILLILAALNTIPTALLLLSNIFLFLHLIFLEPFLWLFRRKREEWGVVYDALTKLPVDLAVVRLYSKETKKLIQTRVTDKQGRYLIIAKEPGKYYLSVSKLGYTYPTQYLKNDTQDIKYYDLYHGEEIEVTDKKSTIAVNIPLDPVEQRVASVKEVLRSYLIKNLRLIVAYLGIILAVLVVIIIPTVITIGALIIHLILFVIFRRLIVPKKPKGWGIIYDSRTKKPVKQAVIKIFDMRFNKLLGAQVTDSKGRYAFLVGKNEYQMLTEKPGYQRKQVRPVDLVRNEEIINLDISLEKE
jgi:uncharacterized repeat protein (TIGR01451 family)